MNNINSALYLALGRAPAVTPLRVFVGGLLALSAWCLGHGVFTSEPINLALSARFSLAHATGIALIAVVTLHTQRRAWLVRSTAALLTGLAASVLVANIDLHGYASVTWYVLLAIAAPLLLTPTVEHRSLELDFGRSRRLVAARDIIAVHGARNYAEVEIGGTPRPGITRMTLESMLQRYPTRLVRVHRSHLVDPKRIIEIRTASHGALVIRLANGTEVPVSPRYAAFVRTLIACVPAAADSSHSTSRGP
jgi:DNA-binding LytR/AlgR family response regulator